MHRPLLSAAALLGAFTMSSPAAASAIWVGVYKHDVTLFSSTRYESGADVQLGWRGVPLQALGAIGRPAPYVLVSGNLNGGTNYAAAGLSWRFGKQVYVRPGIGIAVHDGPLNAVRDGVRVDLGSRVLFEPELAAGWQVSERFSLEASWVHMSHARLFDRQNRGLDSWGVRAVYQLKK